MSVIKPRTATVTIYGGDYLDRIRHLERQAEAAHTSEAAQPLGLDEESQALAVAAEHDALVREAEASALHIVVSALPRKIWRALVAAHQPRKVGEDGATEQQARADAAAGVNELTFREALVCGGSIEVQGRTAAYRSVAAGPLETGADFDDLPDIPERTLDNLADIDFERLYLTAFALNRAPVTDPKASLVSRLTPRSDEI